MLFLLQPTTLNWAKCVSWQPSWTVLNLAVQVRVMVSYFTCFQLPALDFHTVLLLCQNVTSPNPWTAFLEEMSAAYFRHDNIKILSSALSPSQQESHWDAGACSEKGNFSGSLEMVWSTSLRAVVWSGKKETQGRPYCSATTWKESIGCLSL